MAEPTCQCAKAHYPSRWRSKRGSSAKTWQALARFAVPSGILVLKDRYARYAPAPAGVDGMVVRGRIRMRLSDGRGVGPWSVQPGRAATPAATRSSAANRPHAASAADARGLGAAVMSAQRCHCAEGWICEAHPDQPWPHDDSMGPGMRCPTADCPWWRGPLPAALNRADWTHVTHADKTPTRKPN
jgi:hypothetical protein